MRCSSARVGLARSLEKLNRSIDMSIVTCSWNITRSCSNAHSNVTKTYRALRSNTGTLRRRNGGGTRHGEGSTSRCGDQVGTDETGIGGLFMSK